MDINKTHSITAVCELTGISRSTIDSAVKRGEITQYRSACGKLAGYDLAEVKAWQQAERRVGRPPQSSD